ncbi:MAG: sigma factor [Candidatus Micrarchaeota archaeon]
MAQRPVMRFFRPLHIVTTGDVLTHADRISARIQARVKPRIQVQRPLSAFAARVVEIAPRHLHGHYRQREIALKLLKVEGKECPSPLQLHRMCEKLNDCIANLKKRGLIPLTTPQDRPLRVEKLREATPEQIEKNVKFVHVVLKRGHRFLAHDWRRHLSYNHALEVGRDYGLVRALEIFDETKGAKFSTHAMNWIAGAISSELRRRRRMVSMDAVRSASDERTMHDTISRPAPDPAALEDKLALLLRSRRIKKYHVMIWTLHRMYGHSLEELGRFFGKTSRQGISFLVRKADTVLEKKLK